MTNLVEEILDYDEDGKPYEKIEISVVSDGDVRIRYYYYNTDHEEWVKWVDEGAIVPPSLFLRAADKLRSLAADEEVV